MASKRISDSDGRAAVQRWSDGDADRKALATAVRWTLAVLAEQAPGRSVEVRVPPFGAVQCIAGTVHTRGTPPALIETDPSTWLGLATGGLSWAQTVADGSLQASGQRADLSHYLPVVSRLGTAGEPE